MQAYDSGRQGQGVVDQLFDNIEKLDATAVALGYMTADGALTDRGKAYVEELLEQMGAPKRQNNIGLSRSEIGKMNRGVKRRRSAVSVDLARKAGT